MKTMNGKLEIALPKGRMQDKAYNVLAQAGYRSEDYENRGNSRKLIFEGEKATFYLPKASDVAGYVDDGVVDLGICGFDSLREYELGNVTPTGAMAGRGLISDYIPDLKLQTTRFCVAGMLSGKERYISNLKKDFPIVVATCYPGLARAYFAKYYPAKPFDSKNLNGSCELAVRLGADVIFDLVETGDTMRENGLAIYEDRFPNSTKLLLSKAAIRKDGRVMELAETIKQNLACGK